MNATTNTMPRWAYLALALACVAMGLWASYITLEYFEHGAKALETDKALQALAVSAALMFVASEMAAFALAALLTERQLKARRWSLTGFAAAVLALEVCTIVAVQLALTSGADLAQSTVQTQEADLRKRIAALEAGAAAKLATAQQQRATAKNAYELRLSAKSNDGATAEQAQTAALYAELKTVQAQKRPTLVGLMGKKPALAYAIARGVLVSLGGLVFFGVAGALLRASRGGALSVDAQLLALLHELRGTPGQLAELCNSAISAAPSPVQAPALAAPAPASFKPAGAVAPKDASTGLAYSSKAALAGAGALAALSAPMVQAAPQVQPQAKAPAVPLASPANGALGASETVQSGASVSVQSHALESAPAGASETVQSAASVSVHPGASVSVQSHALELAPAGAAETVQTGASVSVQSEAKKPRVKRAVSAKLDTGTDGKAGARFKRIKAAVKAGKIRPSIRGIQAVEGGSQDVVLDYLRQLETEGVIVRNGRGFAVVKKGGAA
jgi:hypothetical protein